METVLAEPAADKTPFSNPNQDSAKADDDHVIGDDEGELKIDKEEVVLIGKDRSLRELFMMENNSELNLNPEWQRKFLWDQKRQSKLIESFLMNIPIPVIYLAQTEDNNYEVVDGLQRLTSIFHFFKNEFKLTGLTCWKDIDGKTFKDLPPSLQKKLQTTTIRTFELSPKTSKNLLFDIFERLNRGGVPLNEMEIRNCIYRGTLNNLIKELALLPDFVGSINQRNIEKRMIDRALVLRFLAFYEKGYKKAQRGLKLFLNDFCENYRNPPDAKLADFKTLFKKATKAGFTVFGDSAYRTRTYDKHGNGQWTSSINASVFQVLTVSFAEYDLIQITQRADAIREEYLDLIGTDEKWLRCVGTSTGDPSKITYAFETWEARLKKVLDGTIPLDSQRIFSEALKKELFAQNPQCAICPNAISSIADAAIDHIEHYWRGGQTIPANARLSHRQCNLTRSHVNV